MTDARPYRYAFRNRYYKADKSDSAPGTEENTVKWTMTSETREAERRKAMDVQSPTSSVPLPVQHQLRVITNRSFFSAKESTCNSREEKKGSRSNNNTVKFLGPSTGNIGAVYLKDSPSISPLPPAGTSTSNHQRPVGSSDYVAGVLGTSPTTYKTKPPPTTGLQQLQGAGEPQEGKSNADVTVSELGIEMEDREKAYWAKQQQQRDDLSSASVVSEDEAQMRAHYFTESKEKDPDY